MFGKIQLDMPYIPEVTAFAQKVQVTMLGFAQLRFYPQLFEKAALRPDAVHPLLFPSDQGIPAAFVRTFSPLPAFLLLDFDGPGPDPGMKITSLLDNLAHRQEAADI